MKILKSKKAFTLAEVLSVVIILGVIAAIVIPTALHRVTESQNKTRVRKALTTYQSVIEKMIIENDIPRSNQSLDQWANNDGDCTNARRYLKGTRNGQGANGGENHCVFRSADGLWYNITNISNTLIGFDDNGRPTNVTDGGNIARGNENRAFALVTSFDNNASIRVQDQGYEHGLNNNNNKQWATRKVQCYLDNDQCNNRNAICSCNTAGCCQSRCRNKVCKETTTQCVNNWAGQSPFNFYGNPQFTFSCQKNEYFDADKNYRYLIEEYDNGNGVFTTSSNQGAGMASPTFYKVTGSGDNATITFAINCGVNTICDAVFNKKGELVKAHTPTSAQKDCNSVQQCKDLFPGCAMTLCTYNKSTGKWENPSEDSAYAQAVTAILENFKNGGDIHYSQENFINNGN